VYEIYFIKCSITFIPNLGMTIANAIWFALHGTYYLAVTAMLDMVNGIVSWFLSPIYGFINWLGGIFHAPPVKFVGVGEDYLIRIQPEYGFAYMAPSPITVKYDQNNNMDLWATIWGMWDFKWMKPGVPIYGTEIVYFISENGAQLYTPNLNPDGVGEIWTKLPDKTVLYTFDSAEMFRQWVGMLTYTSLPRNEPGYEQTPQYNPPPSILQQFAGGILENILKTIYNWYIAPYVPPQGWDIHQNPPGWIP
jgi:hypothetical protein